MKPQELAIGQEAINPAPTLEEIIKWQEEQIKNLEQKALLDEEILDFINAFCLDMGDYWELTERNAIPMIRAILRKAQERCNGFCGEYECKENQSICKRKAQEK